MTRYAAEDKSSSGFGADVEAWPVPYWWATDGGAAVMALLLAAEDEGLGALFFGQFEHEAAGRRNGSASSTVDVPSAPLALLGWPAGRRSVTVAVRRLGGRPDPGEFTHHGRW